MTRSPAAGSIRLKRAYEAPAASDGKRILVDRLWPRGVKKADAAIDLWLKDIAPSTELRKWFGHDPGRWPEFRERYVAELADKGDELDRLRDLARQAPVRRPSRWSTPRATRSTTTPWCCETCCWDSAGSPPAGPSRRITSPVRRRAGALLPPLRSAGSSAGRRPSAP